MTFHRIPLAEAPSNTYGILYKSEYVYRTSKSSSPTRIKVWDNTNRPNPHPGERARWTEYGSIGGDGKYLDPHNKGTNDPTTILITPECTVIDSYGTSTGTVGSGQVYDKDAVIRPGDTLTLEYPDGRLETGCALFTNNGHGHVAIA